jgi:ribonucleoside-diphosphate reductase alpha chain
MSLATRHALSALGRKIFLDRYALKDTERKTLAVGDEVLFQVGNQKELGVLTFLNGTCTVLTADGAEFQGLALDAIDKPIETVEAAQLRLVDAASTIYPEWRSEFNWLLGDGFSRFIPGGRIISALGSGNNVTCMNCYVIPCPEDSREGIFTRLQEMAELHCKGGGVGCNMSTLRPKHAYVRGVDGRSSGSVSWMELYSFVTGLIIQGGSRRGATMLMLADWHPDVQEFISFKRDMKRCNNANVSVIISDRFMKAVQDDLSWQLRFPDTNAPEYTKIWDGNLQAWEAKGLPVVIHKEIQARKLWTEIIGSAHASGEPGIWFQDRVNAEQPNGGYIVACNPCSEQGLSPYSACLLGHVNIASFVRGSAWREDSFLDEGSLLRAVSAGVRFLDTVIDLSHYPIEKCREQQVHERRMGLGTLGLGEALIRLGLRYGQAQALEFTSSLYRRIALTATLESRTMAKERGACPCWSLGQYEASGFGARIIQEIGIPENGLRNATLITQAPCGTVGTMLGTTTGIEPYFDWKWERRGRLGSHIEHASVIKDHHDWREDHKILRAADEDLPTYFVTAMDITPEEHVAMQAAIQPWTDSSISKTCNLPSSATVDDVARIYRLLYDSGCKGGTVYRDNSRDEQVLYKTEAPAAPRVRDYSAVRDSKTVSVGTPCGTVHVTLTEADGEPLEVFALAGRAGSEVMALTEGLGRLLSLLLRVDSPVSSRERLKLAVEQLEGIGGSNPTGLGPNRVASLPDGIGQALRAVLSGSKVTDVPSITKVGDICPSCGEAALRREAGCSSCTSCDYSRC